MCLTAFLDIFTSSNCCMDGYVTTKRCFNNLLVMSNLIADENRFQLMYNQTAVVIVMTQILLPFMVLPLYSVMKTISPTYMRAALNLGASPMHAFYKIYMPNSVPGVSAGCYARIYNCDWILHYT